MWTNSLLKKNAWQSLKSYYWLALGVTILAGILGANSSFSVNFNSSSVMSLEEEMEYMDSEELIFFLVGFLIGILLVWAFAIAWTTFLGGPIRAGQCKFFCAARNGDANFNNLFDSFKGGKYMPTVKTMFFMQLYIFLWSLLFVIPGVIKQYEYFLVPYLVAENPNLPKERAFEISKKTMDGEKMNCFILGLSFIGWYLLGLCACCIGVYAVAPYYQATMAEFYMCMRAKMISYGFTSEEELSGDFSGFNNFGGGFGGSGTNPYDDDNNYGNSYSGNSYGSMNSMNSGNFGRPGDSFGYSTPNNNTANPYSTEMPDITHDANGNPLNNDTNNPYDN